MSKYVSVVEPRNAFGSEGSYETAYGDYRRWYALLESILHRTRHQITAYTTALSYMPTTRYRIVFIDSLDSTSYSLRKPIPVTIEQDGEICVATNYDLQLYGYGDTEGEAIYDLKKSIRECYEDLKGEEELGPIPATMMIYYKEIIEEK